MRLYLSTNGGEVAVLSHRVCGESWGVGDEWGTEAAVGETGVNVRVGNIVLHPILLLGMHVKGGRDGEPEFGFVLFRCSHLKRK